MLAGQAKSLLASLPLRDFGAIFGTAPLLVLAPHPDDESLGCGGLIAEACARGNAPHVAVLTDGQASHPRSRAYPPERLAALRASEVAAAVAALGLPPGHLHLLGAPDGKAPQDGPAFAALADTLTAIIASHGIGTICANWDQDPHRDHAAAARLAGAVAARCGARHLAYPVWAWTVPDDGWLPDGLTGARLDITRHLPAKRRAIDAHASQTTRLIADDPNGFVMPESFRALFERPWEVFLTVG